jgi:hypothetical protein
LSVVGSFLTIDYRQLFTLKKQSYIHQTAEHQLYFLLLLTAFNRTAYGIETNVIQRAGTTHMAF